MYDENKEVWITGMGIVSALGTNPNACFTQLHSAISPLRPLLLHESIHSEHYIDTQLGIQSQVQYPSFLLRKPFLLQLPLRNLPESEESHRELTFISLAQRPSICTDSSGPFDQLSRFVSHPSKPPPTSSTFHPGADPASARPRRGGRSARGAPDG